MEKFKRFIRQIKLISMNWRLFWRLMISLEFIFCHYSH
jgi:hypothetical protein